MFKLRQKKRWLKGISISVATSMLLLCCSACGGSSNGGDTSSAEGDTQKDSGGSNQITVYASLPDYELPTYFNAFEQDTGIKVNYVRLSSGEMLSRIGAEKESPNASIIYGGGNDIYFSADEQGLLEPYLSPELENIPDEFIEESGAYSPTSYGFLAFVCNEEWFEKNNMELPTSWEDLLKPEYKGQLSISHPSTAGTGYAILASIMQLYGEEEGWEYMKALNENVRQYTRAGAAPCADVGLGEAAVGIAYAHDALSVASEGYPMVLSYPKEGTQREVTGVAIVKNGIAGEEENARTLIDWLLSKRGQELYIDSKSFRSPVNVTAEVTEGLPNIDEITFIKYDNAWAAENMDRLNETFMEMINSGTDLQE